MSDREKYCDRDTYDRDSSDILFSYSNASIKSDVELEYYEYYRKLQSKYYHSQMLIRMYEDKPEYHQYKLGKESLNVEICEKLLSKLELTTPIENILQRERKPNEIITLRYLNRDLPNMPYNVYSTRSNFYLSDEEISFIKSIIDDKKPKISKCKENNPKPKPSIEIIEKTQNIKVGVKNMWNYIFCAVISFILSGLYLLGTADMEYSYYQFVRVISFIVIPIFLYVFWKIDKIDDSLDRLVYIPSGIVWLLFNPIFPFYMSKENWIIFDVICATIFFAIEIFLVFLYRYNKKD